MSQYIDNLVYIYTHITEHISEKETTMFIHTLLYMYQLQICPSSATYMPHGQISQCANIYALKQITRNTAQMISHGNNDDDKNAT